jgi:Flp pilus assembly protein TadG
MKRLRDTGGQGLVELALILPLFLVLLLGIVQFGLFFGDYQGITDATRVAARTAALCVSGTTTANQAGTGSSSQATFTYKWRAGNNQGGSFVQTPYVGNTAPNCLNASKVAIASGDQIQVTGTLPSDSINLVFYGFNLTPSSTTTVVVE